MSSTIYDLQQALRSQFSHLSDPIRAKGASAYMKSAMPFYGVAASPMRKVCKEVFLKYPIPDKESWQKAVLVLWREAQFREERYAAIELSGAKPYKAYQGFDLLSMYEEMIVSGAWWDYVDTLAIHRLGPLLLSHPKPMKKQMLAWSLSPNLWKRRSAILCQVAFKDKTDLDLLYRVIEPNLGDREFFIRKSIGWALRSYAWIDPEEVARYVKENENKLSGLSKREAMKNIGK